MPNKLSIMVLAYSLLLEFLFPFMFEYYFCPIYSSFPLVTPVIHRLNLLFLFIVFIICNHYFYGILLDFWRVSKVFFFIHILRWVGMGMRSIILCIEPAKFLVWWKYVVKPSLNKVRASLTWIWWFFVWIIKQVLILISPKELHK